MDERFDELKGNVKKGVGDLTDNERLEAEGTFEAEAARAKRKARGRLDEVAGSVQKGIGELTDSERLKAEGEARRLRGEAEEGG